MRDSQIVYSTDGGKVQKHTNQDTRSTSKDGIVRIHRETKGRKGKGVSIIAGLALPADKLKPLCTDIKKKCGCGGAVKDGTIELQTDDREKIKALLEKHQFTVKIAGS